MLTNQSAMNVGVSVHITPYAVETARQRSATIVGGGHTPRTSRNKCRLNFLHHFRMRKIKMADKRPSLGVIAFAHLCELLNARTPHSKEWFREQIGVSPNTMTKFMRILRNRKLIHVYAWTHDGKRISTRIALWTWGYNRDDAPRPKPVPREVVNRNSKRRRAEFKRSQNVKRLDSKEGHTFSETSACRKGLDLR